MSNPEVVSLVEVRYKGDEELRRFAAGLKDAQGNATAASVGITAALDKLAGGTATFEQTQVAINKVLGLTATQLEKQQRLLQSLSSASPSKSAADYDAALKGLNSTLEKNNGLLLENYSAKERLANLSARTLATAERKAIADKEEAEALKAVAAAQEKVNAAYTRVAEKPLGRKLQSVGYTGTESGSFVNAVPPTAAAILGQSRAQNQATSSAANARLERTWIDAADKAQLASIQSARNEAKLAEATARRAIAKFNTQEAENANRRRIIEGRIDPGGPGGDLPPGGPRGGGGGFAGDFNRGFNGGDRSQIGYTVGHAARLGIVFSAMYRVVNEVVKTFEDAIRQVVAYENATAELHFQTGQTIADSRKLASSLGDISTKYGEQASLGILAGQQAIGVFGGYNKPKNEQDSIAFASADVSAKLARVTGGHVETLNRSLDAMARSFDLGADSLEKLADDAVRAAQKYGATLPATAQLVEAAPEIGVLSRESGLTPELLYNAIASVSAKTGREAPTVVSGLATFLAKQGTGTLTDVLTKQGILVGSPFEKQLALANQYNTLPVPEQQHIVGAGGRAGTSRDILQAYLEELPKIVASSGENTSGTLDKLVTALNNTLGGVLRDLKGAMDKLKSDLGKSGLLDIIGVAVKGLTLFVKILDSAVQVLGLLPKPVLQLLEVLALAKVTGLAGFIGRGGVGANVIGPTLGLRNAAGLASARALEGGAGLAGARLAGAGAAASQVGSGLLASVGGPIGAAVIASALALTYGVHVNNKYNAGVLKATVALENSAHANDENADALKSQADTLHQAAKDARNNRRSVFGIDTAGGAADSRANTLESVATVTDLLHKITASLESGSKGSQNGYFSDFSEEGLTQSLKALSTSGRDATSIMNLYTEALSSNAKEAQAAADKQFNATQTAAKIAKVVPSVVTDTLQGKHFNVKDKFGGFEQFEGNEVAQKLNDALDPVALLSGLRAQIQRSGIKSNNLSKEKVQELIGPQILAGIGLSNLPEEIKAAILPQILEAATKTIYEGIFKDKGVLPKARSQQDALRNISISEPLYQQRKDELLPGDNATGIQIAQDNVKLLEDQLAQARAGTTGEDATEVLRKLRAAKLDLVKFEIARSKLNFSSSNQGQTAGVVKAGQDLISGLVGEAASKGDTEDLTSLLTNATKKQRGDALVILKRTRDTALALAKAAQDDNAARLAIEQYTAGLQAIQASIVASDSDAAVNAAAALARDAGRNDPVQTAKDQYAKAQAAVSDFNSNNPGKQHSVAYQNLLEQSNAAKKAIAEATKNEAQSIHDLTGAQVGGQLAQALSALADANTLVRTAVTDAEKNAAQAASYNADRGLRDALRTYRSNARKIGLDLTNPLVEANEAARLAKEKLTEDTKAFRARNSNGGSTITQAERDQLNSDKLDTQAANTNVESVKFNQRLQAAQTADQLGRTSHQAYLRYLDNEHDRLGAIKHRTFQQQQEYDQISQLMKEAANALSGQFNLGDAGLPSVYQVRRYIKAAGNTSALTGASYGPVSASATTITINGADTGQIIQILSQYMGDGSTYSVTGH